MEKRQASHSSGRSIQSVDIVLVERNARRLRAEYLAAGFRSAANWIRRARAQRAHDDLARSARPIPG